MQVKFLRLFISCPSDCAIYKKTALELIAETNFAQGPQQRVKIEGYTFENMLPAFDRSGAQAVINRNNFGQIDIFLGLMWTKFGAPTAGFGSGTEEEYGRAIEWHIDSHKPAYLLFGFSDEKCSPSKIEPEQLKRVNDFRAKMGQKQLYTTWNTTKEMKKKFREHFGSIIAKEVNNPGNFVLGGIRYI